MSKFFDFLNKQKRGSVHMKIKEKDQSRAHIHFVQINGVFEPWSLIAQDNLVNLKENKEIVVQLLTGGKSIEYAGIGSIKEIKEINTKQRDTSVLPKIVRVLRKTYLNRYYKLELTPVQTTRVFEKNKSGMIYKDEKKTIYLRPNLEYDIDPKLSNPYVNFDVYDSSLKEIKDMRAIVSFKIDIEPWLIPEVMKINKQRKNSLSMSNIKM